MARGNTVPGPDTVIRVLAKGMICRRTLSQPDLASRCANASGAGADRASDPGLASRHRPRCGYRGRDGRRANVDARPRSVQIRDPIHCGGGSSLGKDDRQAAARSNEAQGNRRPVAVRSRHGEAGNRPEGARSTPVVARRLELLFPTKMRRALVPAQRQRASRQQRQEIQQSS